MKEMRAANKLKVAFLNCRPQFLEACPNLKPDFIDAKTRGFNLLALHLMDSSKGLRRLHIQTGKFMIKKRYLYEKIL